MIIVIFAYVTRSVSQWTSGFRVLRIFKVFRIIKSFYSIKQLNKIFSAFLFSLKDNFNVLVLVVPFLICAAFIGNSFFSTYSDFWFGTIPKTMWTLVIYLTQDGWLDSYNELLDQGQIYLAMVFVFIFVWIGAIILINTLVGVSCNSVGVGLKKKM